jgi:hypothetical protein
MAPVTFKAPVAPIVLGSPVAPAVPGDFDSPVTPIVFEAPAPPGGETLDLGAADAAAIVESAWSGSRVGQPSQAPPPPSEVMPLVVPIPLGSPLAPATEDLAGGEGGGIPLETVPYPAVRAHLKPVLPVQLTPEPPVTPLQLIPEAPVAPLQLIPAPTPLLLVPTPVPLQLIPDAPAATPDWLAADPVPMVPENRPPPPAPILLEQPTVVLGPAAEPVPETRLKLTVEAPPSSVVVPDYAAPARQPVPAAAPTVGWGGGAARPADDDADLPMVVPDEVLPPEPARAPAPAARAPSARPSAPPARPSAPPAAPPRTVSAPPPPPRSSRTELFGDPLRPASVIPGEHRVVVHTLAGPLKRGTLRDPDMEGERFELVLPNGGLEAIAVNLIKAIFFMMAPGQQPPQPEGKRTTVTFEDGRQISGFCPEVQGSAPGFFLLPADSRTNTARIYVLRAAVKDIYEG